MIEQSDFISAIDNGRDSIYSKYEIDLNSCPESFRSDIIQLELIKKIKQDSIEMFNNVMSEMYGARMYGSKVSFSGMISENMPDNWKREKNETINQPVWVPKKGDAIGKIMDEFLKTSFMFGDNKIQETIQGILKKAGFKVNDKNFSVGYELSTDFNTLIVEIVGKAPDEKWIKLIK